MTPTTKAAVQTIGAIAAMIAVPILLVVFADFLNIFIIAVTYSAFLALFCYEMYAVINAALLKPMLDDQQATEGFNGDPLKLHFYRGFKKYFDGDLDEHGLQHWLERHRPQI